MYNTFSGGIAHLVEQVLCKHQVAGSSPVASTITRKRGRVAYGVGLENRSVEMHREFESHRFRQDDIARC
jgi:hypothetical protein